MGIRARSFGRMLPAAAILAAAWTCGTSSAATVSWIGATGDWFVGTNWNLGAAPAAVDTAIVANGGIAQASAPVTVAGLLLGSASGATLTAAGSAEIAGGLTLSSQLIAGRAIGAGTAASGSLVTTGTITAQGAAFWEVGVANFGSATGSIAAAGVDTSAQALNLLSVGVASQGGGATGQLSLGAGQVNVNSSVFVGTVFGQQGATAQGALTLGGALAAQGSDRRLAVGSVFGQVGDTGVGGGSGSVEASGLSGFRFVDIGQANTANGLADAGGNPLVTAAGQASIGAGGLVNAVGNGVLGIGVSRGLAVNGIVNGPGASVEGSATVGGDISGYDLVSIGRVENTGRARGSLDLLGGTLTAELLRVGSVQSGGGTPSGPVGSDAEGRLSVVDGAISIVQPAGLGRTEVGSMPLFGADVVNSAHGQLELTRSSLTGGVLDVGVRIGQGVLSAVQGSKIDVIALNAGTSLGTASIMLTDSQLAVRADDVFPGTGSMLVGNAGGTAQVSATRSDVSVDQDLRIAPISSDDANPTEGRVSIVDGTLEVGRFVAIGSFGPGSLGELSLVGSTATVGEILRLGFNANDGTLFGGASLSVDASLLTIGSTLVMDELAAPGLQTAFGIDGVDRGVGGYGAINALAAELAGALRVDFAELDLSSLGAVQSFDLIFTENGFGGTDFGSVQFANLGAGYIVSAFGIVGVEDGQVWRVTLAAAAVPTPGTLGLALAALLGAAAVRRRHAARTAGAA